MISKTASHALKALVALGERPDEFQGAASIAARIGAPQNYLGKLLQTLAQSGLVYSQKGKGGGFQLARKLEAITLFDIVEPIDHVSKWEGCFMGRAPCPGDNPCALHEKWGGVRDLYLATLKETKLADLIDHGGS
ncbi:MAG: Rrf2 family transcriptional regulator [Candidatus Hydrogenedentes bacterium]|nr:Rrf2 family transcriptional regulator [Candidatus Hydrogenedentota bacterium]